MTNKETKWKVVVEKFYNVVETHFYEEVIAPTIEEAEAIVESWDESNTKQPTQIKEYMEFDFEQVNTYPYKKELLPALGEIKKEKR